MLAKRIASAIVALPAVFFLIYIGGLWYSLLIWLIAMIGIREITNMFQPASKVPEYYGYVGVTALFAALYQNDLAIILVVISIIFLLSALNLFVRFQKTSLEESSSIFWGIIYVGGLLGYLLLMRITFAFEFTILLFVVVWANDTFAYFAGGKWGKRKLAPVVSPGKTVEGALGGLFGPVIFLSVLYFFIGQYYPLSLSLTLVLTVYITIFAQIGDLIESALKRKLKTKDSGGIIPGHGGILDRFDSIMFAAPFTYFFLLLIGA